MMLRFLSDDRAGGLRKKPRRSQAVSLVEILIVMAVFGMVLSLAGQMAVCGFRYMRQSSEGQQCWRDAAVVNERVARELRQCEAIVWPVYDDWETGRELSAAPGKNALLACRCRSSQGKNAVLIGYRYLGSKGILERCVYPASYSFSSASLTSDAGMVSRQILLRGVTGFSFWSLPVNKCYGHSLLGVSFTVMPLGAAETYAKKYAGLGMHLCIEVQTRGLR